jgi:hypothetical protein
LEIEILYKYKDSKKDFKIYKPTQSAINLQYFDNILDAPKEKGTRVCNSISEFTRNFPNFIKYKERLKKTDLFDFLKELKVPKQINNFFKIIKESLKSDNTITDEKELLNMDEKIYDYVMEKLYDKIFPREPDPLDNQIFNQCQLLSWTEPKHYIKSKTNLVFDSFLPDVIHYFKEIDIQKSPRQKLIYMNKIFQSISNVVKFSGGGQTGVDDTMPILNYAFIKAKPPHMISNCKYMELFIGDKKNREEGSQLAQLTAICEFAENITPDKLFGIDDEQFLKRCMTTNKRNSII